MEKSDRALLSLGRYLRENAYTFITPTPLTVERANNRPGATPIGLSDIFGWNRWFSRSDLAAELLGYLDAADAISSEHGRCRSKVRFSTIGGQIFIHSAYPTVDSDAVFFGPDTYRFTRTIASVLQDFDQSPPRVVADVGSGSGAGGIYVASQCPGAHVILADLNPQALRYAAINTELNEVVTEPRHSDVLNAVPEKPDLIISNPPYLIDSTRRLYRHGGGEWGCDLSVRIVREALRKLSSRGVFLLYTGTPIVTGSDVFLGEVTPTLKDLTSDFEYEEYDPDVFGEELSRAPYTAADRIAVVRLVVKGINIRGNIHAS